MEVLTKIELRIRHKEILSKIKNGAVFIHPTDTIYGLGCNALDVKAIEKLRRLKDRSTSPFSVWAPSLAWIEEHCQLNSEAQKWLKELPGPYTIITTLKDKNTVPKKQIPLLEIFAERYYANSSLEDLRERSIEDLLGALISHWNFILLKRT